MQLVIAICGKARHGKDTAAGIIKEYLKNKYELDITTRAYADPLKEEACDLLDVDIDELNRCKNENIKISGVVVRKLLQQIADTRKKDNEFYYADTMMLTIASNLDTNYIITDLRFLSEFKRLGSNTHTIKVFRDIPSITNSNHSSEKELEKLHCDYNIVNETLSDFTIKVKEVVDYIMEQQEANEFYKEYR